MSDPKPEEDQEGVNAQPTDDKKGEGLKKDTFYGESQVLKWQLKIKYDGKTNQILERN